MDYEIIPLSAAAETKGCSRQALRNAVKRGDLNEVRAGHYSFIVRDAKWEAYTVKETGGRTHRAYIDKQTGEE